MDASSEQLRHGLGVLSSYLARENAPIVAAWRPGIPPVESNRLIESQLGLRLPEEVRIWFEWHDGVKPKRPGLRGQEFRIGGTGFELLSLEECVDHYRLMRELAERSYREHGVFRPDEAWRPSWLPLLLTGSADLVIIDLSSPDGIAAPVHYFYSHDVPSQSYDARLPSLTEMVAMWLEMFERRLWWFDLERGRWKRNWEETPEHLRRTGLV